MPSPRGTKNTKKPYTRAASSSNTGAKTKKSGKIQQQKKTAPVQATQVCHDDLTKFRDEITTAVSEQLKSFSETVSSMVKDTLATDKGATMVNNGEGLSEQSFPIVQGQADLSQDSNAALLELFKPNATPPSSVSSLATFDLPLGSELNDKIKIKIKTREYINIYSLISSEQTNAPFSISSPNGPDIILRANPPKRSVENIEQWTNAMLIYAAIYIEAHPSELNAVLTYINFVRNMARKTQTNAWRNYDETFRRVRESTPIPWDKPLINQYFEAIISGFQTSPFRGQKGNNQTRVPLGYCFNSHDSKCTRTDCRFKHTCPICSGRHSYKTCSARKQHRGNNNNTNQYQAKSNM